MIYAGPGKIYIYRNKFWSPIEAGNSMYLDSCCQGRPAGGGNNHIYFYHNSINNYRNGIHFEQWNPGDSCKDCLFINNVFNSQRPILANHTDLGSVGDNFCAEDDRIDVWDYNWGVDNGYWQIAEGCAWFGPNNVSSTTQPWNMATLPSDWTLPVGHNARNAGIDVSRAFTVNGTTYAALPGFSAGTRLTWARFRTPVRAGSTLQPEPEKNDAYATKCI